MHLLSELIIIELAEDDFFFVVKIVLVGHGNPRAEYCLRLNSRGELAPWAVHNGTEPTFKIVGATSTVSN